MTSSGPIIEELPDDYEESPRAAPASKRPPAGSAATVAGSDAGAAGLKKGFFNRSAVKPAATEPSEATEPVLAASASNAEATSNTAAVSSGASAPSDQAPADNSATPESGREAEIAGVLEGLRARLSSRERATDDKSDLSEGVSEALEQLRETLTSATAPAARWPTSQARSGMSKASQEANTALAEMRSASNDARRMRSGEEKKAMAELRRSTDEVVERMRKVVELSAPKPVAEEEKTTVTVAAFHALPFTAKLRLIADDRVALGLLITSFSAGMVLVLGILAEVYSAWGCGYRCGQS